MFAQFDLSALFRRRSAKFALAFLAAIVAITLATFTARAWRNKNGSAARRDAVATQPIPAVKATGYVSRPYLWPRLRDAVRALGDRVEKPGKERLILTGQMSRASRGSNKLDVRLILEFPNKLRLEEQDRVTTYDGIALGSSASAMGKAEEDDIESLLFDSAEQFFIGQMQRQGTRELGSGFRAENTGIGNGGVTFYDIYQMVEQRSLKKDVRHQSKFYYFNSATMLLEKVSYQIERDGKPAKVEVRISGWKKVDGQQVPGKIARLVNGAPILELDITSAALGPASPDGIFNIQFTGPLAGRPVTTPHALLEPRL
jgi:hypothetical protein